MTISKDILEKARAWFAAAPSLKLGGIELRDYQVEAGWQSYLHDSLVVLPTGLGKTIVALLHAGLLVADMAEDKHYGIIIMLAPTRALLVQHHELFSEKLAIGKENIHIVDGGMEPQKRKEFYATLATSAPAVLFMTPQTLDNDLQHDAFPRHNLACLVLDEAHHATLDHPYVLIYNDLVRHGFKPRILAMTASPGETEEEIGTLCQTLGIDPKNAIFKDREDEDVAPYIHTITVRRIGVDLPPQWHDALEALMLSLAQCCTWLVMAGIAEADVVTGKQFKKAIPKMFFLDLFQKFSASEEGSPGRFKLLSRPAPAAAADRGVRGRAARGPRCAREGASRVDLGPQAVAGRGAGRDRERFHRRGHAGRPARAGEGARAGRGARGAARHHDRAGAGREGAQPRGRGEGVAGRARLRDPRGAEGAVRQGTPRRVG